ncbi:tau-tubulin kinase homolog Asator, partial [Caerostris darwini]
FKNPEIQLHNMPAVSVTDTLNAEDISSKKSETFKNPEIQIHNMPAVSVSERKYSTSRFLEDNIQRAVLSDVVYENKPSNESSQQNAEFSQSTPNTNDQQHVNRRHRANSENKYVSDESELKLNFTRRRIRPSSAIYEGNPVLECSKELETRMFSKYLSSHSLEKKAVPGNFQNIPVSCLSDELLQPPPGEPPSGYCLPSRRRRYRRAVTSSITDS